ARHVLFWLRLRTYSTRFSPLCSSAAARMPPCSPRYWNWPARSLSRSVWQSTRRSTPHGKSRPSSTAAHPKAKPRPTSRNRSRSCAVSGLTKEREHEHAVRLCIRRLSLHLPDRVSARQPDTLRPRPVHMEERLVAAAAQRHAALEQQPVPYRHPVPVLRPLAWPADAALVLFPLHGSTGQADARNHLWRRLRPPVLRGLDDADLPARVR